MIRLRDASTLAFTKLRTRKIRLFITILISGLLFSMLAAASITARGGFESIETFSKEGFGKRYIVAANHQPAYNLVNNQALIDRAISIHKDMVVRKTAEAKRLDILYDPVTEQLPVREFGDDMNKMRFLDPQHTAGKQAIEEYLVSQKNPDIDTLKQQAAAYGAIKFYQSVPTTTGMSEFKVLKDGKESFEQNGMFLSGPPSGLDSFSQMWQSFDRGMLESFVLPGQSLDEAQTGDIPVIVPVSAAEEFLGMTPLSSSASAAERLDRIKDIRSRSAGIQFEICVRNSTSNELVSRALSAQQEIEANKNKKDYVKPSLIYGLPEAACGDVVVVRDVRTNAEKRLQARQDEFDAVFNKKPDPTQTKFAFRVVGIVPDIATGAASTVGQIVRNLVVSSLGTGWFTPSEFIDGHPELKSLFEDGDSVLHAATPTFYAELPTDDAARRFIGEQHCSPDYGSVAGLDDPDFDPHAECKSQGKYFELYAYGSNSLALESAKRGFGKVFRYAALGVALVAAVIMMGTVGRMITDSRRETAVFRAIGAKRFDIAQIYLLYTVILSVLVCTFAVLAGMILAGFLHSRYSAEITVEALVAFNAQDLERLFKLYSFYWPDMLQLVGLALAGGILSSILPLIRNLRRNPIRDMRDDT